MKILEALGNNYYLWVPLSAWFIAQFYKFISGIIKTKKINISLLSASGGMPSSHSAMVCALATSIAIGEGLSSPLFAIAVVNAFIVMYDALGVRRAVGKQAKTLNALITVLSQKEDFKQKTKKVKEILGHEPLEVYVGGALGIFVACVIMLVFLA